MKKLLLPTLGWLTFGLILWTGSFFYQSQALVSGAPPNGEPESAIPSIDPYQWIRNWVRPEEPTKVALQVGHWKNDELPEELEKLVGNTGATGGGKSEWEVNLSIAEKTKKLLEEKGIVVELIPSTVPEKYYADAFISIHADGNLDSSQTGYKSASPWRDFSGKSAKLNQAIKESYGEVTEMELDDNISRNMRGYYAFSWWRYDHAVHPMTPSIILETGFLTSPQDRKIIVSRPELSADGLAQGIIIFLHNEKLI